MKHTLNQRPNNLIVRTLHITACGKQLEIDFVANLGNSRYYIQSAFAINDASKKEQESIALKNIKDAFKRVVIVKDIVL